MNLYTVIFDFRGGTYIRQVRAFRETEVIMNWLESLNSTEILHFGEASKAMLVKELKDEKLITISETKNVWIGYAILNGHSATIHVILTVE